MMTYWIFIMAIIAGILFTLVKIAVPYFKSKKGNPILEEILFPGGEFQKHKVIDVFRKLTAQQCSDEQIIDFFMKEKGLQMLSINHELPASVEKFVRKPTMIDLNYFDRIKFHETFINYPNDFEVRTVENSHTLFNEIKASKGAVLAGKVVN